MKRVAILMHEYQRPQRHRYLIDVMAKAWQEQGLEVVFAFGCDECVDADLLINQVDLTRTPPEYTRAMAGKTAANRNVTDISKRGYSGQLLCKGDSYAGPVIVKTDCNGGGVPEYRLARFDHVLRAQLRRKTIVAAERLCRRHLAWRTMLNRYPVYQSLAEVPPGVFDNPALIVERFLPERDGETHFLRYYLCLGNHVRSSRVAGSDPFLKRVSCVPVEEGLEVPQGVLDLRERLGLDYGKIDYVMCDGQPVILDVNRTPTCPGSQEANARAVRDLAGGIWSLLAADQPTQAPER
jgi:hypothetical protein